MNECKDCVFRDFETVGCSVHQLIIAKNELIKALIDKFPLSIKAVVYKKIYEENQCPHYISEGVIK